jgi:hypothetical protein
MDRILGPILIRSHSHLLRNLTHKLATSSTLANRICRTQSVTLEIPTDRQVQWEEAAHLVRSMPILRRFKVVTYHMPKESDQQSFYRLFGALGEGVESLRELICVGPSNLSLASHLMNAASRVPKIHTLVIRDLRGSGTAIDWKKCQHWPPIQRLCFENIAFDDAELFTTLVSKTLRTLFELELVDPQWKLTRKLWDQEELGRAIREAGKSQIGLQSLRISLPSGLFVSSTRLVEAIADCRHLRSLQLQGIPRSSQGRFVSCLQAPIEFLFMGTWDDELVRELEENLRPGGTLRPHLKRLLIAERLIGTDDGRMQACRSILGRACAEAGVQLRFCTNFRDRSVYFGEGMWGSATPAA